MFVFDREKLKRLRVEKSMSRPSLSRATGINESDILRLESGKTTNPSFETVEALSIFFKIKMEGFTKEVKD